ncbi:MAG: hypothetical protein LBF27_34030 [Sphingobacterium sp.]|nr:hypothetical protein [Sphingobacterium sp.]
MDENFTLTMELVPANKRVYNVAKASSDVVKKAAVEDDVAANVKYKVAVFDNNGTYVTERDYVRGQETNTAELLLNDGENYTFIAYSINSTNENPEITYSDPANKSLSTSSIESLDGKTNFMYFRKDMTLTSGNENYLAIVFQHKFSQIITVIDASATGKNVVEVEASFSSHFPNADIKLSDAAITRSGAEENVDINFEGLNSPTATGTINLNGNTTAATLNITKMTIGTLTRTDLAPFTGLSISPGVQYHLNITLTPNDVNLIHNGQKAVKIDGNIWMRHNLGADTNSDPDQAPSPVDRIGNYYQFGRPTVVATYNTGTGTIPGWNTSKAPNGSWNSGTETAPVKTSNDPCPSGYRIPTRAEVQNLIDHTNASNIGTWTNNSSANTTGAAKVLTSKINPQVKLTFPIAGYRAADDGQLYWRGGSAAYWTSSVTDTENTRLAIAQNSVTVATGNGNQPANVSKTSGYPIRCIAVQN